MKALAAVARDAEASLSVCLFHVRMRRACGTHLHQRFSKWGVLGPVAAIAASGNLIEMYTSGSHSDLTNQSPGLRTITNPPGHSRKNYCFNPTLSVYRRGD